MHFALRVGKFPQMDAAARAPYDQSAILLKATAVRKTVLCFAALLGALMPIGGMMTARAQENCTPVRFEKGQSSTIIKGVSPPEEAICYSLSVRPGQTANLDVTGRGMIISVIDVGDDRASWKFKTTKPSYKFVVGQEMRSVTREPYTLTVSVR